MEQKWLLWYKKNENLIHGCCSKSLQFRKRNAQASKWAENVKPALDAVNNV